MSGIYLDKKIFKVIVKNAPLVSIDLIIEHNNKFLLGLRRNEPAKNFYFVPGGRVLKGETLKEAFSRISFNEIGISLEFERAKFLGVYEHFYIESIFGEDISTHYIVLAYHIILSEEEAKKISLNNQHSKYKWFSIKDILKNSKVHKYTKNYFINIP